jgi:hypothetical protein
MFFLSKMLNKGVRNNLPYSAGSKEFSATLRDTVKRKLKQSVQFKGLRLQKTSA